MKKVLLIIVVATLVSCNQESKHQPKDPKINALVKSSRNPQSITIKPINDTFALDFFLGERKSNVLKQINEFIKTGKLLPEKKYIFDGSDIKGYEYEFFFSKEKSCKTLILFEFKNDILTKLNIMGTAPESVDSIYSFLINKYGVVDEKNKWFDGYKLISFRQSSGNNFYISFCDYRMIAAEEKKIQQLNKEDSMKQLKKMQSNKNDF